MARPTIANLKRTTSHQYRPSLAALGRKGEHFELIADCQAEDRLRARSSRKVGVLTQDNRQQSAILKLARKLDYAARNKREPKSLACSLHMRSKRDAIFSQLWRLVDSYGGKTTAATVIKRGWELTPDQLETVDLRRLLNGFLADLDRRGAGTADGWLIGFLHGEHESPAGLIRLHLHMIVAGEMIKVVESLREGRNYVFRNDDDVRFRVRIDRKPLTNLPYPFTYCLKSYWPGKHVIEGAHGKRRTRQHKRILEPYHTQVLQFFDRHELNDFVVLKHLSVRNGQLRYTGDDQ